MPHTPITETGTDFEIFTESEESLRTDRMVEIAKKQYANNGYMIVDFHGPPLSQNSFLVMEKNPATSKPHLKAIVSVEVGYNKLAPVIEKDWVLSRGVSFETCIIPESLLQPEHQKSSQQDNRRRRGSRNG
tara:strand:+ start:262 stop:654 length:393 start_codon:yes stop_codon:yes gene_type:complete